MPAAPVPLIDPFDRRVKDLRISITDRCNFRCTYCMPAEGMQWLPRDELLTYEEQARIARVCVERFGFEAVRITGGEPTVRAHLPRLIAMLEPLVVDLAAFGRDRGVGVRFIEFMPLDATGDWSDDQVVPAREILDRIDAVFPLEPVKVPGS